MTAGHTRPKIKICGITRPEDALKAQALGADYIGFIFTKYSPRQITATQARAMTALLTTARPVGVFVEQDLQQTLEIAATAGLHGIQHHRYFHREALAPYFYIHVCSSDALPEFDFSAQLDSIGALLVDKAAPGTYGGTGQSFDWRALPPAQMARIIIAGGIGPDNIAAALALRPFGVDLSSRVESAPGIKDHHKMEQLFEIIGGEQS